MCVCVGAARMRASTPNPRRHHRPRRGPPRLAKCGPCLRVGAAADRAVLLGRDAEERRRLLAAAADELDGGL